jgi:hypothetical protein
MAAVIPIMFPLPTDGGVEKTYAELNRSMSCTCQGGAIIKPSIAPIPGFNMGDIIADQAKLLTALAAGYSMLTVVMKLVSCIIDVLCALTNPFATVAAVIRLFGSCLPDFILLIPQLAVPAMILCMIKIILAIVIYIITVIIPLIQDIIENVQDLIDAISTGNPHAIKAVAFKIVSILKELMNVVGILAALDAILAMVKALFNLGLGIPCGGGGGSCGGCGEDQCPSVFENFTLTGTDGNLVVTVMYGSAALNYLIYFSSISHENDFLALHDFFPDGVDYSSVTDIKKVPYSLYCDGYYAVTSVNEDGYLSLTQLPQAQHSDGYLSSVYNLNGIPTNVDATGRYARFGTRAVKPQFSASDASGRVYLELMDTDSTGAAKNSGTFLITSVYDGYNVKVDHVIASAWTISSSYNPTTGAGSKAVWRKVYVPSTASSRPYTLTINHEELIRRNVISVGCHPDVRAAVKGAKNRSPDLDTAIPVLPDISGYATAAMACITAIAPANVDSQYVIDNYGSIAMAAATAGVCVTDTLGNLTKDMVSYAGKIYPRIFSQDKSLLTADRLVQITGGDIIVGIVPIDINGNRLADDLPSGVIDVKAFTTFGILSSVNEILDAYGMSTGEFQVKLTSRVIGEAKVTATVADRYISDFDTTLNPPNYVTRKLTLTFVDSRPVDTMPQDSREPLGIAGTGGVK